MWRFLVFSTVLLRAGPFLTSPFSSWPLLPDVPTAGSFHHQGTEHTPASLSLGSLKRCSFLSQIVLAVAFFNTRVIACCVCCRIMVPDGEKKKTFMLGSCSVHCEKHTDNQTCQTAIALTRYNFVSQGVHRFLSGALWNHCPKARQWRIPSMHV